MKIKEFKETDTYKDTVSFMQSKGIVGVDELLWDIFNEGYRFNINQKELEAHIENAYVVGYMAAISDAANRDDQIKIAQPKGVEYAKQRVNLLFRMENESM